MQKQCLWMTFLMSAPKVDSFHTPNSPADLQLAPVCVYNTGDRKQTKKPHPHTNKTTNLKTPENPK